jgi:predicted DsbA family dithiol-disulfide isomerase/uncharacterized membrane protein
MASKKTPPPAVSRLNLPIFLVALFGVLVVVHLWIQLDRGFTHGCLGFSAPTGQIAECAEVVGSDFGTVGGVSNVFLGLIFFLGIAAFRFGAVVLRKPPAATLQQASFFAVGGGLLYALYLAGVQLFQLEQVCVLCLISGATTAVLFALHLVEWRRPPGIAAEPRSRASFTPVPYLAGLVALLVLVGADFALMSDKVDSEASPAFAVMEDEDGNFEPTAEQLELACQYDEAMPRFALFDMFTGSQGAFEGERTAAGRALKIFDPNCPHCATLHAQLEPVIPKYRDRVRFYYQPIALWDHSIPQVQAMYLAREHGNEPFLRMMDLQFDRRRPTGIPVDTLVAFAAEIGLDEAQFRADLQRGKYVNVIRSERQMTAGAGINSVPRLIFEGRAINNTQYTWTSECLEYFAANAARQ